jgi:hypothetical protein
MEAERHKTKEVSLRVLLGIASVLVFIVVLVVLLTPEVPDAIKGAMVGGLVGFLSSHVALFTARYLRERGEVDFDVKGWVGSSRGTFPEDDISKAIDLDLDLVTEERHFAVRVHNPKDVNVTLWDFKVTFLQGEKHPLVLYPHDLGSGYRLDPLNVPAQQGVERWVRVSVSKSAKQLRQVYGADKVEMTVTVVGENEPRSKPLPRWSDPDSE